MSNHSSTPPISVPPPSPRQRRASIASGLSFSEHRAGSQGFNAPPTGPMASAMANAQSNHRRRLSITTLGLSGSPTQSLPFGGRNFRQSSISSSVGSSPGNNEEAVAEDTENSPPSGLPRSPFARRVSFGAQALRDARGGSIGNGRYHLSPPVSPVAGKSRAASSAGISARPVNAGPSRTFSASTNKGLPQNDRSNMSRRPIGEGFNWSEALRARAERGPISPGSGQAQQGHGHHRRAASIASMDQPAREIPKQPKQDNKPDFFQEKILRGDFMD
ncbi:uncharacterized protein BJX67DRAFT_128652 [Aspergillus lucknowensis]|uniref:Uncharacterized protein n=1 Tax=Aspergillus lucknowensis TaxID=176173 RepID=A0ABR4LQH0_9EURO